MYNGELVAFGAIVQLILEKRPEKEITEAINFCISVGLPVSFAELSETELTRDDIRKVAVAACDPGSFMDSEPFEVTPDMIFATLTEADSLGRTFLTKER